VRGRTAPLAALLATLLAGGCASSSAGPASSTSSSSAAPTIPAVPGIEAEAVRQRTDEAIGGQVQVRITDTGDEPFTVTSVALDSPGFEPVAPRVHTTAFTPGRVIDLPTRFGDPVCDTPAEPAAAKLTVVRPDGTTEDLRVPLSAEILTRIHTEECAVLAVQQVVTVEVVGLEDTPDSVTGSLRLTRRSGSESVTVTRVARSVIIEVEGPDLPVEMAGDEDELSTPVEFTSATCDPHALAETKKPYVFPLEVTVGDGEPVIMDLPVDDALRAGLERLVDRVCLQG
jgi:hypothetical protein